MITPTSPRKLQIDLDELAFVFHSSEPMIESYLDLQDGRIIMVKIDTRYQLDQIYDEYSLDTAEELDLPLILDRLDISDWERQELLEADEVEAGLDERYIRIPKAVSRQEYQDIEEFIETVQDPRLKEHLEQAISGREAFRGFKDVLLSYPEEQERWFAFQNGRQRQRVLEWLAGEGIEAEVD